MYKIIIGIGLLFAALQVNAAIKQEAQSLWHDLYGDAGAETRASGLSGDERALPYGPDGGSIGSGSFTNQWIAHPGKTDANGCHYDNNGRWHCH